MTRRYADAAPAPYAGSKNLATLRGMALALGEPMIKKNFVEQRRPRFSAVSAHA